MSHWYRSHPYFPYHADVIYCSDAVRIGRFRCHPLDPFFHQTSEIGSGHLLVFPRTAVAIHQEGRAPVVATPNVSVLYNCGQVYRRHKLSEDGDRCEWFAFDPALLVDAIAPFDPAVVDRVEQPFIANQVTISNGLYLMQRQIVEHILLQEQPDSLFIEESVMKLLCHIAGLSTSSGVQPSTTAKRSQRELVEAAQALLSARFHEPLTLQQIADELFVSPFHLARIFRRHTCQTIHGFREQLRLRTALEYLPAFSNRLVELALALGYTSHSHFSSAFRRAFGAPPSSYCSRPRTAYLPYTAAQMSNILIA